MAGVCIVKGCVLKAGDRISLFQAPKSQDLFNEWKIALGDNVKKPLDEKSRVCERHFHEICIKRDSDIKLSDGTVVPQPLTRKTLKPGAIPFRIYTGSMLLCASAILNLIFSHCLLIISRCRGQWNSTESDFINVK